MHMQSFGIGLPFSSSFTKWSVMAFSLSVLTVSCSSRALISARRLLGTSIMEPIVSGESRTRSVSMLASGMQKDRGDTQKHKQRTCRRVPVVMKGVDCLGPGGEGLVVGRKWWHMAVQRHFVDDAGYRANNVQLTGLVNRWDKNLASERGLGRLERHE